MIDLEIFRFDLRELKRTEILELVLAINRELLRREEKT